MPLTFDLGDPNADRQLQQRFEPVFNHVIEDVTLTEHMSWVSCVAISEKYIASGEAGDISGRVINVWNVDTKSFIRAFKVNAVSNCLFISGNKLIAKSSLGQFCVWNIESGDCEMRSNIDPFNNDDDAVALNALLDKITPLLPLEVRTRAFSVFMSSAKESIYGNVRVKIRGNCLDCYNLGSGNLIKTLATSSADGGSSYDYVRIYGDLIYLSRRGTGDFWSFLTGERLHGSYAVNSCIFSTDLCGNTFVVGTDKNEFKIFDYSQEKCLFGLRDPMLGYCYDAYIPVAIHGDTVVTGHHDGTVKVWILVNI